MDKPEEPIRAYALKSGKGWIYRFGIDFTVKRGEAQVGSGAAFLEYTTRKGEEPQRHTHETEDEMFYVLEGAITFRCGNQTFELEKGDFIFLPHGIAHSYEISNEDPVRLIIVTSPIREGTGSGWKGFVSDMETGQGILVASPDHGS